MLAGVQLVAAILLLLMAAAAGDTCGGLLTARHGVVHTPDFPKMFDVPISCRWVIDSSAIPEETVIVIYLTQLFVTTGLTFTEYTYYEPDSSFQLNPKLIYEVSEDDVITTKWVLTRTRYFVIEFNLERLEGNHLRVLDDLLDVYGFNVTYEMSPETPSATSDVTAPRNDSCSVLTCSLAGNCYVSHDFSTFWCKCFDGFYGPGCMLGPLCQENSNLCRNGATCRHVGTSAMCECPPKFTGPHCDVPILHADCEAVKDTEDCSVHCRFDGRLENVCSCDYHTNVSPDRWRYELGIRIGNVSTLSIQHPGHTLFNFLEKQILRYFRPISLSRMEDLKVLSINESGDAVFHFFGSGHDKNRVRDAGVKLVERGHLGDITLLPSTPTFLQESALHLHGVQITKKDRKEGDIRIGDQVILSCVAQGTTFIEFSWFKDGNPINVSKSTGELWTKVLPKDTKEQYSAYLGIESVTPWDEGRYTCQVVDWGVQTCKSVYLEVVQAPSVQILPMSASLQKGENIDLKCVSANELIRPDGAKIGYSWTRDQVLFPLNLGQEVWEDLKPGGSILRVQNIQKSTTYTCMASTQAKQSVRIEVVNQTTMAMCRTERHFGVKWGITAPGSTALAECPNGYYGMAKRQCLISEPGTAFWQRPDFSRCISDKFDAILADFRILARGYMKSSVETCLEELLVLMKSRSGGMYPGEGEPAIELMKDILTYLNRTEGWTELVRSSQHFYTVVDLLLQQPDSIINELRVRDLQVLLNRWSLLLADHYNSSAAHFAHQTYVADIFNVYEDSRFSYYIPNMSNEYPHWYGAKVTIHIVPQFPEVKNTSCIAVVNFRNISNFLPNRSTQKTMDGGEVLYEIQSNVISISVSSHLKVHVELEVPLHATREGWNVTCAVAPSLEATWDFSACHHGLKQNTTLCVCQWPGVYSALLTKHSKMSPGGYGRNSRPSSIVLIGCTCCLVQCLLAFVLLLLRWFHRKTCLLFLKLQCCASVAATMCIFIYCARFPPPTYGFPSINILIEILTLLGLSSHLSKLLVIYTEVVRLPNVQNIKKTVFGITTGVTTLGVLSSVLAHKLVGGELKSWWLPFDSAIFFIFTACGILIVVLFVFLFGNLLHRLRFLLCIQDEKTTVTLNRRIGLLKRTGFLFVFMVCMTSSSIVYVNIPTKTNHYAFSIICAVFGFVIFLCYVLHSETSLNMKLLKQFKIYNSKDHDYSSESENNLFNFFTKQEAEVESDCAPPILKTTPSIAMTNLTPVMEKPFIKPKMVTFNGEPILGDKKENDEVDLEIYPNSPRKFSKGLSGFLLKNDKEPETSQMDHIKFEMSPIPDVLTTQVSVEVDTGLPRSPRLDIRPINEPQVNQPESVPQVVPKVETAQSIQQKSEGLPTIMETEDPEDKDVLDRISHDLDYLLGRSAEEDTQTPYPSQVQRPKKHVTICEGSPSAGYAKTVL